MWKFPLRWEIFARTGHDEGLTAVKIEILYFDGCPSHERLLPLLEQMADARGTQLNRVRVETVDEAERLRFLGSPSVRVDGRDVEPGADERFDFGMTCRLYRSAAGQSGVPPREWIEEALREAAGPPTPD